MRLRKLSLYNFACGVLALACFSSCGRQVPVASVDLLRRLPMDNATVLQIDVAALRTAGLLKAFARGKGAIEPEYQAFLTGTGFEYERDLDLALASFGPSGTFLILKGRFDWPKLEAYAGNNGGSCFHQLCRMPGSVPERRISYLPLTPNVMAMAVSTNDLAASQMTKEPPATSTRQVPAEPVWLSVPGNALRANTALPPATRIFTAALGASEQVLFTLGPAGQAYEAKLTATCKSAEDARVMTVQLTKLTEMLKGFLGKAKGAGGQDLGGFVAGGMFTQTGTKVLGLWPVRRELLDSLAGGG